MPGLVRKVLIFAAVDGLILQPLAPRGQRPTPPVKISYKDHNIVPVAKDEYDSSASESNFEAFGVIGELLLAQDLGRIFQLCPRNKSSRLHSQTSAASMTRSANSRI